MSWRDRHSIIPAVYCIFRDGDKILLLRRANTGYMDGFYGLPSGHLDGGEPAEVAACREAKEEAGVDIRPEDLRLVYTLHRKAQEGDHERIDLFFEVKNWTGQPQNAEPHKCDELRWSAIADLPNNTIPEVQKTLEKIAQGELYSSLGF